MRLLHRTRPQAIAESKAAGMVNRKLPHRSITPASPALLLALGVSLCAAPCLAQTEPPFPVPIHETCPQPAPRSSCRAAPTCRTHGSSHIWQLGAVFLKGEFCASGPAGSPAGTCDDAGRCVPPSSGPSGTVHPAYYLIAVVYAPPGSKSKVSYSSGSTLGTTSDIAAGFGVGFTAGVTGNVIALDNTRRHTKAIPRCRLPRRPAASWSGTPPWMQWITLRTRSMFGTTPRSVTRNSTNPPLPSRSGLASTARR